MTRDLQISDAAQMSDITADRHDIDCFVQGANWADAHRWHKCDEELPDSDRTVLAITHGGFLFVGYLDGKRWYYAESDERLRPTVEYWMDIPKIPDEPALASGDELLKNGN